MSNRTYWQAEIYQGGRVIDCDFPHRERPEDALSDVRDAINGKYATRKYISGSAVEWKETPGDCTTNTGRFVNIE
jgi:hypothetical protein